MPRKKTTTSKPVLALTASLLSRMELHWLGVLAEHATDEAVGEHARELLTGGASEADVRAARVAAWSSTCSLEVCSMFAPAGLGVRSEAEVKRARAWRDEWITANLRNRDGALYLAVLYEVPRPEAWQEAPRYGPSPAALAVDLAGRIAEVRARAWHAAWGYTPKGYRLRKGFTDPALEWTDTPQECAKRAMGIYDPDPREVAGQLRLPHTG